MSKRCYATLKGGPCDGEKVEIIGIFHEKAIRRPGYARQFFKARYVWSRAEDGQYVGTFAGYWDRGDRRVDKLGRRMARA